MADSHDVKNSSSSSLSSSAVITRAEQWVRWLETETKARRADGMEWIASGYVETAEVIKDLLTLVRGQQQVFEAGFRAGHAHQGYGPDALDMLRAFHRYQLAADPRGGTRPPQVDDDTA